MDDHDAHTPLHAIASGLVVAGGFGVASATAYIGTPGTVLSPTIHTESGLHQVDYPLSPIESLGWAAAIAIPLAADAVRRLPFVFKRHDVI
jgi:hypothetical protein